MTSQIQNVAIVGVGMVSRTHLMSVADLSDSLRLAGVLSRNADNAKIFANEAQKLCGYDVKTYNDIDAICADDAVDFVILLTPPNARQEIVEKLAQAGKSILMEKPIERDSIAAEEIVKVCERHYVSLGIVFQHRVREASQKLVELIAASTLGELVIAEVVVPWWREQSYYDEPGRGTYARDGGGVLISQAIHSLDLMLSLTGRVSEVQAMAHTTALHQMEAEDYVTAAMRFENGAAGSMIASTASYPGDAESIVLHFTNCVVRLQAGELHLHWQDGRKEVIGAVATTGGGADPMAFTHEWHREIIADFASALSDARPPLVSGRTALDVHVLIDAIIASSTEKRTITVHYPDIEQT